MNKQLRIKSQSEGKYLFMFEGLTLAELLYIAEGFEAHGLIDKRTYLRALSKECGKTYEQLLELYEQNIPL